MDKIWNLAVAIFILVTALALMVAGYALQQLVIGVLSFYAGLICLVWGVIKGTAVIVKYRKEEKSKV